MSDASAGLDRAPLALIETSPSTALQITAFRVGEQAFVEIQSVYRLRRGPLRKAWIAGQRVTLPAAALPALLAALVEAAEAAEQQAPPGGATRSAAALPAP